MNRVVHCELDPLEHRALLERLESAKAANHVLDYAFGAPSLLVRPGMVSRRLRNLGTEQPPQTTLKRSGESRIAIRQECLE